MYNYIQSHIFAGETAVVECEAPRLSQGIPCLFSELSPANNHLE